MKKTILIIPILFFLQTILFAQLEVSVKNGKYGYVDDKGNVRISYKYDKANEFDDGFAFVEQNGKFYVIDTLGNEYLYADDINNLSNETLALHLSYLELTEIPKKVFDNAQLKFLILSDNRLKHVPSEIGKLKNLIYLDLHHNQIPNLPSEIGKLEKLIGFDLSSNKLNKLPNEIGNLFNLKLLVLEGNPISDTEKEKIRKLLPNCEITFKNNQKLYKK